MTDKKKQRVSVATFKQWQTEYEKEYQSLSWLRCTTDEHDPLLVDTLTCAVCTNIFLVYIVNITTLMFQNIKILCPTKYDK